MHLKIYLITRYTYNKEMQNVTRGVIVQFFFIFFFCLFGCKYNSKQTQRCFVFPPSQKPPLQGPAFVQLTLCIESAVSRPASTPAYTIYAYKWPDYHHHHRSIDIVRTYLAVP